MTQCRCTTTSLGQVSCAWEPQETRWWTRNLLNCTRPPAWKNQVWSIIAECKCHVLTTWCCHHLCPLHQHYFVYDEITSVQISLGTWNCHEHDNQNNMQRKCHLMRQPRMQCPRIITRVAASHSLVSHAKPTPRRSRPPPRDLRMNNRQIFYRFTRRSPEFRSCRLREIIAVCCVDPASSSLSSLEATFAGCAFGGLFHSSFARGTSAWCACFFLLQKGNRPWLRYDKAENHSWLHAL